MPNTRQHATNIIRTLRERGHQAYLVGGCVRDLLLGREPADYDVATDATPQRVMEIFPQTFAVGAQFGVALVPLPKNESSASSVGPGEKVPVVEVATFRSDVGYSDGRHPDEVRFSSDPQEDVLRRDFTINGLFYDVEREEVIDALNGHMCRCTGYVKIVEAVLAVAAR
jgi:poly(A) polymerase